MVKQLVISSVLVALVIASASGVRAAPPDPRASVATMLAGYEHVPSAADWARVGPPAEVAAALMDVAHTGKVIAAARATSSLAHFPRPEVQAFLAARVGDAALRPTLRGKAAIALGRAFGDAAAPTIAPLFASPDPDLREDAIRAFASFATSASESFLRARATKDPVPRLGERMRTTAERIAGERARRLLVTPDGPTLLVDPDQEVDVTIEDPGPVRR
ncbi:MAG: hypothetical protein IT385_05515 [Deltaproteobacteria bacterium]|nr:hypothetical protein [Deltaproteobacteria bacterium]